MTYQVPTFLLQQNLNNPYRRTFFQRCGHLGIWVLPAEVLDVTPLSDDAIPNEPFPSLRTLNSKDGLCFAHVEYSFATDLYWAWVAATPDLAEAERIVLTENVLFYARPWDVRLVGKSPSCIRRLLFACAQEVRPIQVHARNIPSDDLMPAPIVPLVAAETVEVSTADLQEALGSEAQNSSQELAPEPVGTFALQQGLLRVVLRALQRQVAHARSVMVVQSLLARCALLARLQRWHQKTRQRVVNAAPGWCGARRSVIWSLTVGVPLALLEATPPLKTLTC